jgi:triphosphatase
VKEKIVEGDNQPPPEAPAGEAQPAAAPAATQTHEAAAMQSALSRLLRSRLKKFVALAPEIRANAEAKTIHDARVWSRRFQQALDAFFAKPRPAKVRRLRRTPRRIRRALGKWRNFDVLLEIVAQEQRRTRSVAKRQAWTGIRDYLLQKRTKEVARASKRVVREDLGEYAARAQRVVRQASDESPEILMQRLGASVQEAQIAWQSSLTQARSTRAADDLHRLRIATKVLRYRTELLYDVGAKHFKPQLKWLAALQEALGVWHDRQVFHRAVAEALARPEVLLNEMQAVRLLLAEVEKERSRQANDIENVFRLAMESPENQQIKIGSESDETLRLPTITETANEKD